MNKTMTMMKTNRIFFWMLGCIAVLSALQGLQAQTPGLSYPVPLDEAHFPDEMFREYLMGRYIDGYNYNIDKNGDGQLSVEECGAVDKITVWGHDITSLEGIEYFYALTWLDCSNNQLTSLDVSGCTVLEYLDCSGNQLTSLDASGCIALKTLDCSYNPGTSLDLSGCTSLKKIGKGIGTVAVVNIADNPLTSLNVSGCTALTDLDCDGNQLTSLDVSGCTALTDLDCDGNQLTNLDVSGCTALETLDCSSNQLASLDASGCTALETLDCSSNQLASLDASGCAALTTLECYDNQPMSLNLSGCTSFRRLSFRNTYYNSYHLTSLDVSGCAALKKLECDGNQLANLDLDGCSALTYLDCCNNALTGLDVSGCIVLDTLGCSSNGLASLDLSRNTALRKLKCNGNELTDLGLSQHTALIDLDCSSNALTSLDVSGCTALTDLDCSGNQLTNLDLSGCTSLKEIGTWAFDVNIAGNPLTSLNVSGCTALENLRCGNMQLTSLDVSGCTALETLDCSSNQLTSLDVSGCTALETLDCSSNQLASLDASGCTALESLHCSDNRLACLDLSQCNRLYAFEGNGQEVDVNVDGSNRFNLAGFIRENGGDVANVSCEALSEDGMVSFFFPSLGYTYYSYYSGWGDATMNVVLTASNYNNYVVVEIDEAHFPDSVFRSFVAGNMDFNWNGKIELAESRGFRYYGQGSYDGAQWTYLDVSDRGIRDLSGIEYFPFIQSIDCSGNEIDSLDLSGLEHLNGLDCSGNPALSHLELFDNSRLVSLGCSGTALEVDFSQYPSLQTLACADMGLDSIDLSQNTALTGLDCSGNQLTSLDLSGCTALQTLDCSDNALLDLDVRSLLALRELDCSKNQLASLDLFRNTSLTSVKADGNYREVLVNQDRQFDISTLPRFERARMEDIEGGTLQGDILTFHQDEVRYFYSYNNADPNLPLGEYFHLKAVQAPVPGIAINDTTFPDAVFRGYIAENADTDKDGLLSESEIAGVTGLDVSGMGIQDLRGIGYFTALQSLDCSDNALTSLDLSANTALQTLNAGGNRLDIVLDEDNTFDVSSLPGFEMAKASNWTGCTRMGNRLTFTQQEVTYAYATGYSGSAEDASLKSVTFSLFADRDPSVAPERIVSIDEEHFPDSVFREYITAADLDTDHWLDEDEIAGVTGIDVSGMGIQDLRGIGYFTALESLDCSDNALTSLDLSANTALQTLNASGNRLDIVLDESNAFDVSSLPGFNMAKASDWTGCTRMGNKLTFTQQEVTYAYATGYSGSAEDASLKSVTFSLFADRDPSMGNETSDLQPQGRVYAKDRTLFTEGISGEVSVFTAVGTLVYQGKDTRIPVHQAGTYIVRHGEQVWKILVM